MKPIGGPELRSATKNGWTDTQIIYLVHLYILYYLVAVRFQAETILGIGVRWTLTRTKWKLVSTLTPRTKVRRLSYCQLDRRSPCLVWEERKFTFYHAKGSFFLNTPLFTWHLNFVFWFLSSSVTPPLFFEAGGVQWIRRRESERGEIEVQRREASRPKHISRTNINCWL